MGGWSKRSTGIGAIFAAAAASLFGRQDTGAPVLTRGSTPLGVRVVQLVQHGNKVPSATKAGPGRYHRGGRPKRAVGGEVFVCEVERIPLYMNAGARRRYLALQGAAHG